MHRLAALLAAATALPLFAQEKPPSGWTEVLRLDERAVVGFGFSPDARRFAVSGRDYVEIRTFPENKLVHQFRQYELVDEALFSPNDRHLITRSTTQDTLIHETSGFEKLKFALEIGRAGAAGSRSHKCPAAFSPDGNWLVLANGGSGIRFWRLDGLADKRPFVFEIGFAELGFRGESMMLGHVNAFEFVDGDCWLAFDGGYAYPIPMYLPEDAWRAFQGSRGRNPDPLKREDVERRMRGPDGGLSTRPRTLDQKWCFKPHENHVTSLEAVGEELITAGWEGKVKFWKRGADLVQLHDTRNNEEWRRRKWEPLATIPGYVVRAAPDGRTLAVAEAWRVALVDAATRKTVDVIEHSPPIGRPVRMRFTEGGSHLAVSYCCCTDCVDEYVIRLTSAPPKRVHHHGGTLVVYKRK